MSDHFCTDFPLYAHSSSFSNPLLAGLEPYISATHPTATAIAAHADDSKWSSSGEADSTKFDEYSILDYFSPQTPFFPAELTQFPASWFGVSSTSVSLPPEANIIGGFRGDGNAAIQCSSDECCGFAHVKKPVLPSPVIEETQGAQGGKQMPSEDQSNAKVGKYSAEERKDRILRYLNKRNRRNFTKTIKYACRKTLADRRVRIRGRFARNNEPCEQETFINASNRNGNQNLHKEEQYYSGIEDAHFQIGNDDDGWLQEAISNLVCMPYEGMNLMSIRHQQTPPAAQI